MNERNDKMSLFVRIDGKCGLRKHEADGGVMKREYGLQTHIAMSVTDVREAGAERSFPLIRLMSTCFFFMFKNSEHSRTRADHMFCN